MNEVSDILAMSGVMGQQAPLLLCAVSLFAFGFFLGVLLSRIKHPQDENVAAVIQSLVLLWLVVKFGILPSYQSMKPQQHKDHGNSGLVPIQTQNPGMVEDALYWEYLESISASLAHQGKLSEHQMPLRCHGSPGVSNSDLLDSV
jgi:hypothetical protein